jgi:hypothetical protein
MGPRLRRTGAGGVAAREMDAMVNNQQRLAFNLLDRVLDLVLSSRFWAALIVGGVLAWLVVANPIQITQDGRLVAPGLPAELSEMLGMDELTLEDPEPPR